MPSFFFLLLCTNWVPCALFSLDDCPAAWVEFQGKLGVFLEGQVTPPLRGVDILITASGEQPMEEIKVQTDDQGKYR